MKERTGRTWTNEQKRAAKIRRWIAVNSDIIEALMADAKLVKILKLKIQAA